MTRARKRWPLAVMAAACLSLSSCLTTALWQADDGGGGQEDWSTEDVLARMALTPFTLALDLLTISLQCGGCAADRPAGCHPH